MSRFEVLHQRVVWKIAIVSTGKILEQEEYELYSQGVVDFEIQSDMNSGTSWI